MIKLSLFTNVYLLLHRKLAITHSTVNQDCLGLVIPVELKQLNEESPQTEYAGVLQRFIYM